MDSSQPPSYKEAMELNVPPPSYEEIFSEGPSDETTIEIVPPPLPSETTIEIVPPSPPSYEEITVEDPSIQRRRELICCFNLAGVASGFLIFISIVLYIIYVFVHVIYNLYL